MTLLFIFDNREIRFAASWEVLISRMSDNTDKNTQWVPIDKPIFFNENLTFFFYYFNFWVLNCKA